MVASPKRFLTILYTFYCTPTVVTIYISYVCVYAYIWRERKMSKMLHFKMSFPLTTCCKVHQMANYSSRKQKATPKFIAVAS